MAGRKLVHGQGGWVVRRLEARAFLVVGGRDLSEGSRALREAVPQECTLLARVHGLESVCERGGGRHHAWVALVHVEDNHALVGTPALEVGVRALDCSPWRLAPLHMDGRPLAACRTWVPEAPSHGALADVSYSHVAAPPRGDRRSPAHRVARVAARRAASHSLECNNGQS